MKLRRYLIGVLCLLCFLSFPTYAAEGTIQIQMPDELKDSEVHCEVNGEPSCVYIDENGEFLLRGLEPDVYDISIQDTEQFVFGSMEIPVPMWDEEAQKMEYDITVIPKYSRISKVPETGDTFGTAMICWGGVAMFSVAGIVLLLSKKK